MAILNQQESIAVYIYKVTFTKNSNSFTAKNSYQARLYINPPIGTHYISVHPDSDLQTTRLNFLEQWGEVWLVDNHDKF